MQSAASANVAQAIESIDAERRPETFNAISDLRPRYADTTTPHLEGRLPRPPSVQGTIEQLHPHQRSGSSAVGSTGASDHLGMPPPERPRATRIRKRPRKDCFNLLLTYIANLQTSGTSGTPLHRVALPGTSRSNANRSQIPMATARTNQFHAQDVPTVARGHFGQSHKIAGSTPGPKIGRTGTARSFDNNSFRLDQYRGLVSLESHPESNC